MRIQHTTYRKIIAALILLSCVSPLFAQDSKTYYVTAEATDGGDGSSWTQAITLENALRKATAGDEIWVKGYEDITGHIYKAPEGGFVLPSGVAMYGGFAGDETIKNDHPTGRHKYQMKYQTALVGDINTNDKAEPAADYLSREHHPQRQCHPCADPPDGRNTGQHQRRQQANHCFRFPYRSR